MVQATIMSLDQLCTKYSLNRNVLAFEMRRLKGQGVPEEQFIMFLQLKSEGYVKFPTREFSVKLAPKEAVFYADSFFLSLRDLCREYNIQPSLVKQYHKQGVSLTTAINKAIQKAGHLQYKPQPLVEARRTSKEELDFLNLIPTSRAVIEKHNLDARALIYEAKNKGIPLDDYILLVDEKIMASGEQVSATTQTPSHAPTFSTNTSVERSVSRRGVGSKTSIRALGEDKALYNAHKLNNDATALRLPIQDFVTQLQQYNMLPLYLKEELQPTFSFRGSVYPTFEVFVQNNGLHIIDVRLLIFHAKGDIEKALGVAFSSKQKPSGSRGKAVMYKGNRYDSMRKLSTTFNIPYDSLVKNLKVCFLPNPPRTVDEVVDELIYNSQNNYVTVDGKRIVLKTSERSYKNVAQLCQVENISQHHLGRALKQGYTLEQAIKYAKTKTN